MGAAERPVVAACGLPDFNCCMKGCPAAPTTIAFKTLKRRLPVIPVDEFRTSKVCARCDEEMLAPRKAVTLDDWRVVMKEVRGIRLCKKCFLETHGHHSYERDDGMWPGYARFDRDINAALNILRVAGLSSSERPASLQRITRAPYPMERVEYSLGGEWAP
jgi:hypothetical protein